MHSTAAVWDYPRSAAATSDLFAIGCKHGVPGAALLEGTGLTAAAMADEDCVLEAHQELAVTRNLLHWMGNAPGLGAEAADRYAFGSLGVFGFAMLSSATVREALSVAVRFASLSSAFLEVSYLEHGSDAVVSFEDDQIPTDVRDFLVERDLAAIMRLCSAWFGDVVSAATVRLETRLCADRAAWVAARLPSAVVAPDQTANRLVVDRRLLDVPLSTADAKTARMCLRESDELLRRRFTHSPFTAAVKARLLGGALSLPTVEEVAHDLAVSERTLRRRLSEDGTSFRDLLDATRETMAIALLSGTTLSVDAVARRLSYADGASFTRAFIRWRGQPPGAFRRVATGQSRYRQ